MFVKPRCHLDAAIFDRTVSKSKVRPCKLIAGFMVVPPVPSLSSIRCPFQNKATPILTAGFPKYFGLYFWVRLTAKFFTISYPCFFQRATCIQSDDQILLCNADFIA